MDAGFSPPTVVICSSGGICDARRGARPDMGLAVTRGARTGDDFLPPGAAASTAVDAEKRRRCETLEELDAAPTEGAPAGGSVTGSDAARTAWRLFPAIPALSMAIIPPAIGRMPDASESARLLNHQNPSPAHPSADPPIVAAIIGVVSAEPAAPVPTGSGSRSMIRPVSRHRRIAIETVTSTGMCTAKGARSVRVGCVPCFLCSAA